MQKILKYIPLLFVVAIGIASALFGYTENPFKVLTIIVFLLVWVVIFFRKDGFTASIIFLILIFPFTLSFQVQFFKELGYVEGVYVNYLIPTVYLLDVGVVLLLLSVLSEYKKIHFSRRSRFAIGLILLAWIAHNILFLDLSVFFNSLRILLYLFAFISIYMLRDKLFFIFYRSKKLIFALIVLLLFVQLFIAIVQIAGGTYIGIEWLGESMVSAGNVNSSTIDLNGQLILRGYGTFPHPNLLAGYGVFIFTIFLTLYKPLKIVGRRSLVFMSVLTFLLVFVTFSHGGLLAYGAILVAYVVYLVYLKYFREKEVDIRGLGALLILTDRSIKERILLIESSWEYILDNLLIGVGSGNFLKGFYKYSPNGEKGISLMQPVHNIYILIMVEYGLFLGLFLNLLLIMFFIYRFIVSKYKIIVLLFLIYLLVLGSVDHYLITLPQGLFLFLSIFLYLALVG